MFDRAQRVHGSERITCANLKNKRLERCLTRKVGSCMMLHVMKSLGKPSSFPLISTGPSGQAWHWHSLRILALALECSVAPWTQVHPRYQWRWWIQGRGAQFHYTDLSHGANKQCQHWWAVLNKCRSFCLAPQANYRLSKGSRACSVHGNPGQPAKLQNMTTVIHQILKEDYCKFNLQKPASLGGNKIAKRGFKQYQKPQNII